MLYNENDPLRSRHISTGDFLKTSACDERAVLIAPVILCLRNDYHSERRRHAPSNKQTYTRQRLCICHTVTVAVQFHSTTVPPPHPPPTDFVP